MAERLARVEAKVDALDDKMDMFIKTATSPDIGFVSSGLLGMMKSQSDLEHITMNKRIDEVLLRANKRIDEINTDHNERITKLEGLSSRVLLWAVFLFGGVAVDIALHVSGVKP